MTDDKILNLWECNKITCKEALEMARVDMIDELLYCLKNPITVDALVNAKDKFTVIAILKRQVEQLKENK